MACPCAGASASPSDRRVGSYLTSFFTADHHFGHANIIRLCSRPFADVVQMDEAMIDRWNAVVGSSDEVWYLGNFAYRCSPIHRTEIFRRLRGRAIHLVLGAHDRKATLDLPWASIQRYAEIAVEGRSLVLFHYPLRAWRRAATGTMSLHGYSHGALPEIPQACDVGVDCWDFRPVVLDDIMERMTSETADD
jgi:calcineurin-like phosphoesterase family protein